MPPSPINTACCICLLQNCNSYLREHGSRSAAEPVAEQHRSYEPVQEGLAQLRVELSLPARENVLEVKHLHTRAVFLEGNEVLLVQRCNTQVDEDLELGFRDVWINQQNCRQ